MDIKFPRQENSFRRTMLQAVASCIAALCVGMFLGNALGSLFGVDPSVINTSNYTDQMAAIRTMFSDADQLDSYSRTALALQDMNGLKLYTGRNHDRVVAQWEGSRRDASELFDEELQLCFRELMNPADALYGLETAAGEPVDNIYLRNVAVTDGVVYYYLYYDPVGFVGLAFDSTGDTLVNQGDSALPLTKTPVDSETGQGGVYEWFITYRLED